MEIQMKAFLVATTFLCLTSIVDAIQGNAVFFNPPYHPSVCYGDNDNGKMVMGVSDALWNHGGACGKKYKVTCIGKANDNVHNPCKIGQSVVVEVVDYCKPGCEGVIDLSRDAFAAIADLSAGMIQVQIKPA